MKNISELNRGGRDCWRILGTSVSCGKGYDSVRDRQKAKKKGLGESVEKRQRMRLEG